MLNDLKKTNENLKELKKLLNTGESISIPCSWLSVLTPPAAFIYALLLKEASNKEIKEHSENPELLIPVAFFKNYGFTQFRQANTLNELKRLKLLTIRFGQGKTRYISLNDDLEYVLKILKGFGISAEDKTQLLELKQSLKNLKTKYNLSDRNIQQLLKGD